MKNIGYLLIFATDQSIYFFNIVFLKEPKIMKLRSLKTGMAIGLAALGLALAGQAVATPVVPGGTNIMLKYSDYEAFITPSGAVDTGAAVGDTAIEIFDVSSINNAAHPATTYWASGISDGTELLGYITGVTVTAIIPNLTGAQVLETGGAMTMYEVAAGTFNPTSPLASLASQVCPGGVCPAAFLTATDVAGIIPLDPVTTVALQVTGLTAPSTGQGAGDLLITGGTFASALGPNAVFNSDLSTCVGATGGFATLCTGAGTWPAVSQDPVTATTVPEPASLALLGLGLTGMALARRRRN